MTPACTRLIRTTEHDLKAVRFDVGLRGYRMAQVDRVLRRTAYDIGYKDEMIAVLEAEVTALREGRAEDAELLRKAREAAAAPPPAPVTVAPAATVVPGAHRADTDEAETDGTEEDVAESPPEVDEQLDDATAPGTLNRAALRRVEDPAAEDTSDEPSPPDTPDTSEDRVSDGVDEAHRRART
jgi:DivIVA domain-containing protein